jgi:cell shape-determining protein MreC
MIDEYLVRLRELASMTGAPTWLPNVILEIEEMEARLEQLEDQNADLRTQLAFYRRRVAA